MFAFWAPIMDESLKGIWRLGWDAAYRLPILVAFVALCISFVFWPAEKNLGTLISYTAAVMIAVQFWHGFDGGLYMAWYLPLALLAIFRPNMNGRVAQAELRETAWQRSRSEQVDDLLPAA
jgi:cell division protein FtsW (lipid II flippase)